MWNYIRFQPIKGNNCGLIPTDTLRLMTAAPQFTTVELQMLTRYGASTILVGRATLASRPPTNVHDLMVVM